MKRYWFTFNIKSAFDLPPGVAIGCGVTAFDYPDAIQLIEANVFRDQKMPPVKNVVENVNISTLDQGHVIPNMKSPTNRGVWFPLGYD